jgi:hypothetical protein
MISQLHIPEVFLHFVARGGILDMTAQTHSIFLIRRPEIDDVLRSCLAPISATVEIKMMAAINRMQRLDRINLYLRLKSVPASRVVAGMLYESLGHTRLCEGIILPLKRMTRRKEGELFHWKHETPTSNSMSDNILIHIPANEAIIYEPRMTSVQRYHLHVPKARNQPGFDSFFLGDFLYIFQLTRAETHNIKPCIVEFFDGLENLPPKAHWRFVLITPPDCHVNVNAPSVVATFLEDVRLYSAHLEIYLSDDAEMR